VDGVAEIVQALCFDKQPFFGDVRKKVDVVIVATPAAETAHLCHDFGQYALMVGSRALLQSFVNARHALQKFSRPFDEYALRDFILEWLGDGSFASRSLPRSPGMERRRRVGSPARRGRDAGARQAGRSLIGTQQQEYGGGN